MEHKGKSEGADYGTKHDSPFSPTLPPLEDFPGCRGSPQSLSRSREASFSVENSPTREKRGSRARRRLSSMETDTPTSANAGVDECSVDLPVIDTTSAEVERTADGTVTKVNEYIVIRDLGRGSSAEVKLCRLVPAFARPSVDGANTRETTEGGDMFQIQEGSNVDREEENDSDLYAIKIFDRAEMMRRGRRFARPRVRGSDGRVLRGEVLPEAFMKVQREIAIMKKLVHPNVVQLVEVIDAPLDSSLYMVMEYVERGAVMSCVDPERGGYRSPRTGGCLDTWTAASFFADVLAGLEYLHLNSIAHRDLKPENILIGEDDRAKIADFGVSKYFADDNARTPRTAGSFASTGSRVQMSNAEGTWCFWAPEMCGAEASVSNAYAVDAWAAGVTLWCFLYGVVPFFSASPMDLFDAIASESPSVPPEADSELRDLFARMLEKDPTKRQTVPDACAHDWVRSNARQMICPDSTTSLATPTSAKVDAAPDRLLGLSGWNGSDGASEGRPTLVSGGRGCDYDDHTRHGGVVSVTEADLRAAVTEAPSSVLVAKMKDRIHGKIRAMRLSNERGAEHAVAAAAAATAGLLSKSRSPSRGRKHGSAACVEEIFSPGHERSRASSFTCVAS